MRVSVIGTVHEDTGAGTASELYAILARLIPEVIFLEMPASVVADFFGGGRSNLESTAVSRYRELFPVELVAVDLPTPEPEHFWGFEQLHRELCNRSREYHWLVRQDRQYAETYGFAYLNSEHSRKLVSERHAACLTALNEMGDRRFAEFYERWTSMNEQRDEAMLQNIRSYCDGAKHETGAFLVGAAHLESLIAKSAADAEIEPPPITWSFDDVT